MAIMQPIEKTIKQPGRHTPLKFKSILDRIAAGQTVPQREILPYLCQEEVKERFRTNFELAEAFTRAGQYVQAKVFVERAWILSRFSDDTLGLLTKLCHITGDIDTLREAYKRRGIRLAREGKLEQALEFFNLWQYAYASHYHLDRYSYDFDIMDMVDEMAKSRWLPTAPQSSTPRAKLRLAYLVFGMTHINSVLVKINLMFAKHHKKDLFEIVFFVPESKSQLQQNPDQLRVIVQQFQQSGCKVIFTPNKVQGINRLVSCARQITEFSPDILITSAALADFEHYFIVALRPAPLVVGLLQGPPQQFVAPCLDWAISWSQHPLIDSPVGTSLVKIGITLPTPPETILDRTSFGIPQNAVILMSAGRHFKYQHKDLWQNLIALLHENPTLYYLAVGVRRDQVPCLDILDISSVSDRIKFLGWRTDCVDLLTIADVLIDTYPSGGGHVLIDAMSLGIPFVSFENNYLKQYDQTDWSVADEFVDIPELILPRGDFTSFRDAVNTLIKDSGYRRKMGALCKEKIMESMDDPAKGVAEFEDQLLRLTNVRRSKNCVTKEETKKTTSNLGIFSRVWQQYRNR